MTSHDLDKCLGTTEARRPRDLLALYTHKPTSPEVILLYLDNARKFGWVNKPRDIIKISSTFKILVYNNI